ncbi:MAG TPA: hypothetical protein VGH19_16115 [Verrucomicrobiae bacterium]
MSDFSGDRQARFELFVAGGATPPPIVFDFSVPVDMYRRYVWLAAGVSKPYGGGLVSCRGVLRFMLNNRDMLVLPFEVTLGGVGGNRTAISYGDPDYPVAGPQPYIKLTNTTSNNYLYVPCYQFNVKCQRIRMDIDQGNYVNSGQSIFLGAQVVSQYESI